MPKISVESIYNVLLSKILLVLYIISVLMCSCFFCSRKTKLYFHSILYHLLLFAIIYFLSSSEMARTLNSSTSRQFSLGTFPSPPCTHYYYSIYLHPVVILRICCALILRDPYLFIPLQSMPHISLPQRSFGDTSVSNNFIVNLIFSL